MTHGGQFPPSPEDRDQADRAWSDAEPGMARTVVVSAVVLALTVVFVVAVAILLL